MAAMSGALLEIENIRLVVRRNLDLNPEIADLDVEVADDGDYARVIAKGYGGSIVDRRDTTKAVFTIERLIKTWLKFRRAEIEGSPVLPDSDATIVMVRS